MDSIVNQHYCNRHSLLSSAILSPATNCPGLVSYSEIRAIECLGIKIKLPHGIFYKKK